MTKNWYAVYTKPNREKRVSSILNKKGIEYFCPINYIVKTNNRKPVLAPLFNSFMFVYIGDKEIQSLLCNVPDIVNFMYWKSSPAVIKKEEIDLVKKLTLNYVNIKLEKIKVNADGNSFVTDEPKAPYPENRSLKYQTLKVTLPSLGYTMFAERERIDHEPVGSDFSQLKLINRGLNSVFSN